MIKAFISLGSNMGGDPERNLVRARKELERRRLNILGASSIYRTEPWGYDDQPWFLNQVLAVECPLLLSAESLLTMLQATELRMGRVREEDPALKYGPRIIDLDILLYGAETIRTTKLRVPHPHLCERAFVLVPLLELAPDACMPSGELLRTCLERLDYTVNGVEISQRSA